MNELRALADRIAGDLIEELKAGKLEKIGLDEIRAACAREQQKVHEALVEMTTRRVVERA
jgi:pyruvate formate-lyase activating enzyme-like uncharacterized protein